MIAPLRRAHRIVWLLLPPFLLALFAASLAVRTDPTPINPGLHLP
jgi:hypothetical protein